MTDERLRWLAHLLDSSIPLPGIGTRVGWDAVLGLIPGIGDVVTGLMGFLFVVAAWQRGLSNVTLARMLVNIGVDTLFGSIPILGDVFDAFWKSNEMNYRLLIRDQAKVRSSSTWRDWIFLTAVFLVGVVVVAFPILTATLIIRRFMH